jgi:hypothetical protein
MTSQAGNYHFAFVDLIADRSERNQYVQSTPEDQGILVRHSNIYYLALGENNLPEGANAPYRWPAGDFLDV